jgi:putative transposase
MSDYRRSYVPGGTFFFTIVTDQRRPLFASAENVERLRAAVHIVQQERPFEFVAGITLPEHLHFIWTMPPNDADYSSRIGRMKAQFSRLLNEAGATSNPSRVSRRAHRESDVWQRRFWEHPIVDERDLENHFNYLHFNPVKHGLVGCPHLWKASSFKHWVKRKVYEPDWCCACTGAKIKAPYPDEFGSTCGE